MNYTLNNQLRTTMLIDGTAEDKLDTILILMNSETFGQRKAAGLVGGRGRLYRLVEEGKIRTDKLTNKQNGKWFCNASDVLRYALIKYKKSRKAKKYEKVSHERVTD